MYKKNFANIIFSRYIPTCLDSFGNCFFNFGKVMKFVEERPGPEKNCFPKIIYSNIIRSFFYILQ